MPTRTYIRFWCKKCQEYTLHNRERCTDCSTPTEDYNILEVPNEKILEQRERYKQMRRDRFKKIFSVFNQNVLGEIFSETPKTEIIECDAGQKKLDKIAAQKREEKYQEALVKKKIYNEKFRHLNRNEKCGCESGLKYKKCCWNKYN